MADHFSAFTFVDRIDAIVPGKRGHGRFLIPSHLERFPAALIAEAVGQLAAWVSISALDFRARPVAALAGETRFPGIARPGDVLDLTVEIETCAEDAVDYRGRACVGDRAVLELMDCVGPMLPLADFDDPETMRSFFARLRGAGATPGRLAALPSIAVIPVVDDDARARLAVPVDAPFFADHFPRRPVFPATLLLDAQIALAADVVRRRLDGPPPIITRVTDVKLRAFIAPGSSVDLGAEMVALDDSRAQVQVMARMGDRRLGGARVEFALGGLH